ncbi:hypothetical protein [Edaphobacillus lindanitolerans]|uniref:Uncharacterized protein n=1 Tax=Edaphobacillus lindanitolerans TaxID=550447 RepID=A0A1U7PII9_9BACI|nr:hypothetical protein [Edaphobacillus lindanitolerans]SIT74153.1 hypothetical protein SAMN05428946_1053 [Edaphobacillus lindanitolerans]
MDIFFFILTVFGLIAGGFTIVRFFVDRVHYRQPSVRHFFTRMRWIMAVTLSCLLLAFVMTQGGFNLMYVYVGLFVVSIFGMIITLVDYVACKRLGVRRETRWHGALLILFAVAFALSIGSPGLDR